MSPNEWGQENELHMRTWQLSKKDLQGNKYLNGVQKVWEPHSVLIHYQWTVTWYWNLVEWKHFLYRLMQTDTNVLLLPWLMQLRESNTFNNINCNFMIKGLQIRSARCLCCFMVKVHKEHSSIVKEVALCLYDTHYLTCVIVGIWHYMDKLASYKEPLILAQTKIHNSQRDGEGGILSPGQSGLTGSFSDLVINARTHIQLCIIALTHPPFHHHFLPPPTSCRIFAPLCRRSAFLDSSIVAADLALNK